MNTRNGNTTDATSRNAGEASGKHRGLRQPADDEGNADALDKVGLDDRGASMEDHLRDRRGKGVAGEYDDSIDHDAADVSATGVDIDAIAGNADTDGDGSGERRGAREDADDATGAAAKPRRST